MTIYAEMSEAEAGEVFALCRECKLDCLYLQYREFFYLFNIARSMGWTRYKGTDARRCRSFRACGVRVNCSDYGEKYIARLRRFT